MRVTRRIKLDRISSSTHNARLGNDVFVGPDVIAEEGYILAVRILDDKSSYNMVEDPSGRMIPLRAGDVLAGTLGSRRALKGYAGVVPDSIELGDTIDVLNLGGVLGRCTSSHPDHGRPFSAEVLGAVHVFPALGDRVGRPAHIKDGAIPPADVLAARVPVVYVAGTCMSSGKTAAATELTRGLARRGRRVAAAKLTGVALMRDTLAMMDAGAVAAATFNDAGAASTHAGMTVRLARGLFNHLAAASPDVVVAELGDGILGDYGVQDILEDAELMGLAGAIVMAAPDPVGCWGAVALMKDVYGLPVDVVTGPATDNEVGRDYVHRALGLPAHNAFKDPHGLVGAVTRALEDGRGAGAVAAHCRAR
jgi:hypothetical protein